MALQKTECEVIHRPDDDALRFLPEGPYYLGDSRLSWVAIQHGAESMTGSLNQLNLNDGANQTHQLSGRPGFAFPTDQPGRFVVGLERSLGFFDTADGVWSPFVTDVDSHAENTIINDGVVFEDNLIFGCKHLEFSRRIAGLYLYRGSDRQLIRLRDDQICSNGKAVVRQPNGDLVLLDIDSPSKKITSSVLDVTAGTLSPPRTVVDLTREEIFPDGMIVTPDGSSVIVAIYDPGTPKAGVARQYSLTTGQLQAVWLTPGSSRVTCPQLAERNGSIELVLTTCVEHMPDDQQQMYPEAGSMFAGKTSFESTGEQPIFPTSAA